MKLRNLVTATGATILVAMVSIIGVLAASSETLEVTPTNTYGWSWFSQSTATGSFVDGNAPTGFETGSFQQTTGAGSGTGPGSGGKTWLSTNQHNGTKLADIESLSYSTYVDPASTAASHLTTAIQLQIDLDGNGTRDTTMVFEPVYSPTQGAVVKGQWQTWDAKAGNWWFTTTTAFGGSQVVFPSFDAIVGAYPNATIVEWFAHTTGAGVQLVAGQNSAGPPWTGFIGNVDGFTIGVDDNAGGEDVVAYNFELYSTPTTADQCKNGGYKTFNPAAGPYKNQGQCIQFVNTGK